VVVLNDPKKGFTMSKTVSVNADIPSYEVIQVLNTCRDRYPLPKVLEAFDDEGVVILHYDLRDNEIETDDLRLEMEDYMSEVSSYEVRVKVTKEYEGEDVIDYEVVLIGEQWFDDTGYPLPDSPEASYEQKLLELLIDPEFNIHSLVQALNNSGRFATKLKLGAEVVPSKGKTPAKILMTLSQNPTDSVDLIHSLDSDKYLVAEELSSFFPCMPASEINTSGPKMIECNIDEMDRPCI